MLRFVNKGLSPSGISEEPGLGFGCWWFLGWTRGLSALPCAQTQRSCEISFRDPCWLCAPIQMFGHCCWITGSQEFSLFGYFGPVQDLPSGLIELSVLGAVMNGFVCRGAASPLSQRSQLFTPWQGEVLTDTKHKQMWRKGLSPGFSRKKSTEPSVWAVVNIELFRLGKVF